MQAETSAQALATAQPPLPATGPNAAILAENEWITEKELIHVGRFSRSFLYRIPLDQLPRYKLGGKTLYKSADVKVLLTNLTPVAVK